MFSYSRDLTIHGGSFTNVTTAPTYIGIDKLIKAANPNAMHNSSARYDPPKCHPGTREAILEHIMQWIFGSDDRDALILWLYGPAGAGKSAILQSIAEKCAALDILLASFFFSRSDGTRNHPGSLIATIASQISARIPEMSPALHSAIVRDPMIFEKTLDAQIDLLIVGPLTHLAQSGYFADRKSSPRLILIDGLDECNDLGHRRGVLYAIARALRVHQLPFIFLVSSRPETDIKFSFDSAELVNLWDSLVLDNSYTTRDDIRLFLTDSFQYIKETHPRKEHIPPSWPTSSVVDTLIAKSSGQFIYPSVVIQYISALNVSPRQQLDVILGIRAARWSDVPFAEIDALYMHILSSVQDTQLMLDILAILMNYYFHIGQTRRSLDISAFLGVDQEDVDIILSSLTSLTDTLGEGHFYISHASLSDFLADKKRSGRFHIDRAQYTSRLVHQGIKWLCSYTGLGSDSCPPTNRSMLDFFHIHEEVSMSRPQWQIKDDLNQDSDSLPLGLIWNKLELIIVGSGWNEKAFKHLVRILKQLQLKGKFEAVETTTSVDLNYQEAYKKFAIRLKHFCKTQLSKYMKWTCFPALMETLGHDFPLNGTCYSEALTQVLARHSNYGITRSTMESVCSLIKDIGLSPTNAGKNPYIHTALAILGSLTTQCHNRKIRLGLYIDEKFNVESGHIFINPTSWKYIDISNYMRQYTGKALNSGKLAKFRREIRLRKLHPGMRERLLGSKICYCDRTLVSKFLIPILDLCPKSDELLALINRRMRRICLKYTSRRRLMDALYRYIRRTSEVGKP